MIRFVPTAALALVVCGPALAQDATMAQRLRQACGADTRALCGTVAPGGGRVLLCLDANRERLSDACRAALPPSDVLRARLGAGN